MDDAAACVPHAPGHTDCRPDPAMLIQGRSACQFDARTADTESSGMGARHARNLVVLDVGVSNLEDSEAVVCRLQRCAEVSIIVVSVRGDPPDQVSIHGGDLN